MILDDIVQHKKLELEKSRRNTPLEDLRSKLRDLDEPRDFYNVSISSDSIKIIAEIK